MDGEDFPLHEKLLFYLLGHERHIRKLAPSAFNESNQLSMTPLLETSLLLFHSIDKETLPKPSENLSRCIHLQVPLSY